MSSGQRVCLHHCLWTSVDRFVAFVFGRIKILMVWDMRLSANTSKCKKLSDRSMEKKCYLSQNWGHRLLNFAGLIPVRAAMKFGHFPN